MKTFKKFGWLIVVLVALTACNFPGSKQGQITPTVNMVQTAAAMTVEAIRTGQSSDGDGIEVIPTNTPANQETQAALPTNTLQPTDTKVPALPTSTPWPTYTPLPTYTPYPSNTPTPPAPCNQMKFIRDVTIPDETWMRPEQEFTKIWEVQNTGSCSWDAGYSIVYGDSGGMLGASASKSMPSTPVDPGEKVQIAIAFTAPDSDGIYTSVWRMQDGSGNKFGEINVTIDVDGNPDTIHFTDMLCSAEWRSAAGILPCPNEKNNQNGAMYITDDPKFENGHEDNEDTLIMIPQQKNDGEIKGEFFMVKMPANPAHFRTIFGCTAGNNDCNVYISVHYRVEGTDTNYLVGDWDEEFDGSVQHIDIDLTSKGLEGKRVYFTFTVKTKGSYADDEIFFLLPRIEVP